MYPCGNIYHNGIGTFHSGGQVKMAGDDFYFHRVLEPKYGMKHVTVFDSPVYHIIEGEKDEIDLHSPQRFTSPKHNSWSDSFTIRQLKLEGSKL